MFFQVVFVVDSLASACQTPVLLLLLLHHSSFLFIFSFSYVCVIIALVFYLWYILWGGLLLLLGAGRGRKVACRPFLV